MTPVGGNLVSINMATYPRVQVLLRDGVFELVNKISEKDNLSVSKVCGMLIQEALAARNLWDMDTSQPKMTPEEEAFVQTQAAQPQAGPQAPAAPPSIQQALGLIGG